MTNLEKLVAEYPLLTSNERKLLKNILNYHGVNKSDASKRISQVLKIPLQENKILSILND
jgi:hypothetical protein